MCALLTLGIEARLGADPGASSRRGWAYTVVVDDALLVLSVRLCVLGLSPTGIEPAEPIGARYLEGPPVREKGRSPCFRYRIDLGRAIRRESEGDDARAVGKDVVFNPDIWLFVPTNVPTDHADVTVAFELPPGVSVSVPWPRRASSGGARSEYSIPRSTFLLRSKMALGHFSPVTVPVGDSVLDVIVLDHPTTVTREAIVAWARRAGEAVAGAYGRFPVPRDQVIVYPVPGGGGVRFGLGLRGGGATTLLFLSELATEDALLRDWVLVHELSHLLLPYVAREDAWLSEGLATYYQNVLRARHGEISEREAWQALHDGFSRGARAQNSRTLAEASARMREEHNYMRVYWGGAALVLLADLRLRTRSDGRLSLDRALEKIAHFRGEDERVYSGKALLTALDRATGTTTFETLAREIVESSRFPSLETTYRELGVDVSGRELRLDDEAKLAAHRRAIMR